MTPDPKEDFKKSIEDFLEELLSQYNPGKIRAPKIIRDAVLGHNIFYQHEINLIDSPLLQRLRRVHQTALAYLTYPAATHTRFEHSLGCVAFAQKMIDALNRSSETTLIDEVQTAEVRLAALLHDVGHALFSHASEIVYDNWDPRGEILALRRANLELSGEPEGHEILSYYIVKSDRFKRLWQAIIANYEMTQKKFICNLSRINFDRVANMIIGAKASADYPTWISKIINGPFDVDKLDYMGRDGYFSGLVTPIDTDRLFVSLSVFNPHQGEPFICVDITGATVLEQILFDKMLLFSSVYDHHKVRGSFRMIASLLEKIRSRHLSVNGVHLNCVADFLRLDEYSLLSPKHGSKELNIRVKNLCERILPRRALVITPQALVGGMTQEAFFELGQQRRKINDMEKELAQKANCDTVFIDFPPRPHVEKIGEQSMVRFSKERAEPLSKLYPASGWIRGYSQYRRRAYVLASAGCEQRVAKLAGELFASEGIKLDQNLCLELAKHSETMGV
jgi:HD superfamily phosphohydrolase